MADTSSKKKKVLGPFEADFVYTDQVLNDFEQFYQNKQRTSPIVRIIFGVVGAVGAVYFGYTLYAEGFAISRTGYLIICSLLLLIAFSRGGVTNHDDTLEKYRKYYRNQKVHFEIDEDGVDMHLEGQKNNSHSKFTRIYDLFDTDLCFYFVIKGKAYYIIPKKAVNGGTAEELHDYMETHCKKQFLHYSF